MTRAPPHPIFLVTLLVEMIVRRNSYGDIKGNIGENELNDIDYFFLKNHWEMLQIS